MEHPRLKEVQGEPEDHHNLGGHAPAAEVGEERDEREGEVREPDFELEVRARRLPPEAPRVALVTRRRASLS